MRSSAAVMASTRAQICVTGRFTSTAAFHLGTTGASALAAVRRVGSSGALRRLTATTPTPGVGGMAAASTRRGYLAGSAFSWSLEDRRRISDVLKERVESLGNGGGASTTGNGGDGVTVVAAHEAATVRRACELAEQWVKEAEDTARGLKTPKKEEDSSAQKGVRNPPEHADDDDGTTRGGSSVLKRFRIGWSSSSGAASTRSSSSSSGAADREGTTAARSSTTMERTAEWRKRAVAEIKERLPQAHHWLVDDVNRLLDDLYAGAAAKSHAEKLLETVQLRSVTRADIETAQRQLVEARSHEKALFDGPRDDAYFDRANIAAQQTKQAEATLYIVQLCMAEQEKTLRESEAQTGLFKLAVWGARNAWAGVSVLLIGLVYLVSALYHFVLWLFGCTTTQRLRRIERQLGGVATSTAEAAAHHHQHEPSIATSTTTATVSSTVSAGSDEDASMTPVDHKDDSAAVPTVSVESCGSQAGEGIAFEGDNSEVPPSATPQHLHLAMDSTADVAERPVAVSTAWAELCVALHRLLYALMQWLRGTQPPPRREAQLADGDAVLYG